MNEKINITLRAEITPDDIRDLRRWTDDAEVVKYLNEDRNIAKTLEELENRTDIPALSPFFNRGGRFFMICAPDDGTVGFMRLTEGLLETEIVLAIGDRMRWGRGLGGSAIRRALETVFFEWREKKVVANIHVRNVRSQRAFRKNGFRETGSGESGGCRRFELTMRDYLDMLASEREVSDEKTFG